MSKVKRKFFKTVFGTILFSALTAGAFLTNFNGHQFRSTAKIQTNTANAVENPLSDVTEPIVPINPNDNQTKNDSASDIINLGEYSLILSQKNFFDVNASQTKLETFIGIYNYLLVPVGNVIEIDGYTHIQLIDRKNPSWGFIATNENNQFAKFSFGSGNTIICDYQQKDLSQTLALNNGSSLSFVSGDWINQTQTGDNPNKPIHSLYLFDTSANQNNVNYWVWDLAKNTLITKDTQIVTINDASYNFDHLQLVQNYSFDGTFHAFFNLMNNTTSAGWVYLTSFFDATQTKVSSRTIALNQLDASASQFRDSSLISVGWNQWSTKNSFIGQGIYQNHFYYFAMPSTIDMLNQFPLYVTWNDVNGVVSTNAYFNQLLFLKPDNEKSYQGLWILTNDHKEVKFVDLHYSYDSFEPFGNRETIQSIVTGLSTKTDINQLGQADSIKQIVFNDKIKRLMIIYSFNHQLASYNFSTDGLSLNIVPISINDDEYNKLREQWKNQFSSEYTKSANKTASISKLLNINGYYSKLYANNEFGILFHANDLFGTLQLQLQIIDPYFQKNIISVFEDSFHGFKKINTSELGNYTISLSSPVLALTPSELRKQLNDTTPIRPGSDITIGQTIKQEIFNLFGFVDEYKNLNYSIEVGSSSVLGHVQVVVCFQTIFEEKVGKIYELFDNKNDQEQPSTSQPSPTPVQKNVRGSEYSKQLKLLANSDTDLSSILFQHDFKLRMEKWFIPVVIAACLILLTFVGVSIGLKFKKQIKRKVVDLLSRDGEVPQQAVEKTTNDLTLTTDYANETEPKTMVVDKTVISTNQSQSSANLDAYNRFQSFLSDLHRSDENN